MCTKNYDMKLWEGNAAKVRERNALFHKELKK